MEPITVINFDRDKIHRNNTADFDDEPRVRTQDLNCAGSFAARRMPDVPQLKLSINIIPPRERWLQNNPTAMASIRRGLEDAEYGRIVDLGSFAEYTDVEIDD